MITRLCYTFSFVARSESPPSIAAASQAMDPTTYPSIRRMFKSLIDLYFWARDLKVEACIEECYVDGGGFALPGARS